MFDRTSEAGKKLEERLQREMVIWLTTVGTNGIPLPTPVWFLWDGTSFLMYTQPGSRKLRNIAFNARAALNLNSDEWGGSVVVFTGEVRAQPDEPPAIQNPDYVEKYRQGIADINMTPESFSRDFSTALRFYPTHLRLD